MTVTDDLALLQRWRDGDTAAGDALVSRHFGAVRKFFRNKLPGPDVEDALQRTFLGCVEARDAFRGDASFRTFLFTVARRELFRVLRRRKTDAVAGGLDFTVRSLFDLGVSPSRAASSSEEQQIVLEALRRLPVEQQVLLELYYWEEIPGPELAKVLDVAEATVRTRLYRARKRLAELTSELLGKDRAVDDVERTARALAKP